MRNFMGLSLHPLDAFKNLSSIIEVAGLLTAVTDDEYQEISDVLIAFSAKYADAAREAIEGDQK
ncbi:MAG: hypothetical protein ACRCZ6_14985 [Kluyvera sp.]|uniref:hypothetical protein n=1 Tax=Kluyvera sp. TaxID=1538228 RepID=UPI003F2ABF48